MSDGDHAGLLRSVSVARGDLTKAELEVTHFQNKARFSASATWAFLALALLVGYRALVTTIDNAALIAGTILLFIITAVALVNWSIYSTEKLTRMVTREEANIELSRSVEALFSHERDERNQNHDQDR